MILFSIGSFASSATSSGVSSLDNEGPCAVYTSHYVDGEYSHTTVERMWGLSCSGIDNETSYTTSSQSIMLDGN